MPRSAAFEDFRGAAVTVRFDDGALEVETAADPGRDRWWRCPASDAGDDVLVATLPDDTVAAFGCGFADGWFTEMVDTLPSWAVRDDRRRADGRDVRGVRPRPARRTPRRWLGDAIAVAMGSDLDLEAFFNGGPDELPVGVKIQGDPDAIEAALDKVRPRSAPTPTCSRPRSRATRHAQPQRRLPRRAARDGGLGDSEAFEEVVEEADEAAAVLFVDFDADDNWLARPPARRTRRSPRTSSRSRFGITGWLDDGVSHSCSGSPRST